VPRPVPEDPYRALGFGPEGGRVFCHFHQALRPELYGDVQLPGVPGVLRQHVEADPLQGRRIVGEPAARGRGGLEREVAQDRRRPLPDRGQPLGEMLGTLLRSSRSTRWSSLMVRA
jgi:hypothetical protein